MNTFNTAQVNFQQFMPKDGKLMTLKAYAMDIANKYSDYSIENRRYILDVDVDLPDFIQQQFAARILSNDAVISGEVTGPDNPMYDREMFPSLLNLLSHPTDKEKEIDFINAWRDGVTNNLKESMQNLINDALFVINYENLS